MSDLLNRIEETLDKCTMTGGSFELDCEELLRDCLDALQAKEESLDKANTQIGRMREIVKEVEGKQFEILGWVHAFFCTELDDGKDPRNTEVPVMVEKAIKQLGLKDKNVFSDCGCRFESDTGNSVILCEKCSELPCHTPPTDKGERL